jgi:hypothetical protein
MNDYPCTGEPAQPGLALILTTVLDDREEIRAVTLERQQIEAVDFYSDPEPHQ